MRRASLQMHPESRDQTSQIEPATSTAELEQLTTQIRNAYFDVVISVPASLERAMECGKLLDKAEKKALRGEWRSFVENACGLSFRAAIAFRRLWINRKAIHLPSKAQPSARFVGEPVTLIGGANATDPTPLKFPRVYPAHEPPPAFPVDAASSAAVLVVDAKAAHEFDDSRPIAMMGPSDQESDVAVQDIGERAAPQLTGVERQTIADPRVAMIAAAVQLLAAYANLRQLTSRHLGAHADVPRSAVGLAMRLRVALVKLERPLEAIEKLVAARPAKSACGAHVVAGAVAGPATGPLAAHRRKGASPCRGAA